MTKRNIDNLRKPTGSRMRIKRQDVLDALSTHGPMSRAELEKLFAVPERNTSIQTHVTSMREDGVLYIIEWQPPAKTGMWTPVYDRRTDAKEEDAPHPPPRNRWRKTAEVPEDMGDPVILRGVGMKKEHVIMAMTRSATLGLGMWGGLITRWN